MTSKLLKLLFLAMLFCSAFTSCRTTRTEDGELTENEELCIDAAVFHDIGDYKRSATLYKKAAESGSARAQYNLAYFYAKGIGVEKDLSQAIEWYKKAADSGFGKAQYNLGVMYYDGEGVEQNYLEAKEWYEKAALQGIPQAQHNLALIYGLGKGVDKDTAKEKEWYEKAAQNNDPNAQFNLGVIYLKNDEDYKAFKWFMRSAQSGDVNSIHAIGALHEEGIGTERNYKEAEKWYKKALEKKGAVAKASSSLAYLWAKQGINLTEAERLAKQALDKNPKDPWFNGTLGWVYYKQKKYNKAIVQLQKAISLFPKEKTESIAIDLDHLGDAYSKIKQPEKAIEQWKKGLELTKDKELKKQLEKKLKEKK